MSLASRCFLYTMMAPYRTANEIPDRVQVKPLAYGEIPTLYFNLGANPYSTQEVYKKHRDASAIANALVGNHNSLEGINPGLNTADPGAADVAGENAISDQWRDMQLGYPNKKVLVLGSLYQNGSVNSIDPNGRGFIRNPNAAVNLYHFIAEKYSIQMGDIVDVLRVGDPNNPAPGSVPGDPWKYSYIDQAPQGEGFPSELNNGPITSIQYDDLVMPIEELLAQVAKGLNDPFLIKNNMMDYKIELSIPVKF